MGASSRRSRASDSARELVNHPYVQRLIEDEELRDNIAAAYKSARNAYGRMSNGKGPATALMDDKKLQRELREAAESLRDASQQIRGRRQRRRGGFGKWVVAGLLGAGAVLAFS